MCKTCDATTAAGVLLQDMLVGKGQPMTTEHLDQMLTVAVNIAGWAIARLPDRDQRRSAQSWLPGAVKKQMQHHRNGMPPVAH